MRDETAVRRNLDKPFEVLLLENSTVEFNWELAKKVCVERSLPWRVGHLVGKNPTIGQFLETFTRPDVRLEWLAFYAEEWKGFFHGPWSEYFLDQHQTDQIRLVEKPDWFCYKADFRLRKHSCILKNTRTLFPFQFPTFNLFVMTRKQNFWYTIFLSFICKNFWSSVNIMT